MREGPDRTKPHFREVTIRTVKRDRTFTEPINPVTAFVMLVFHAGAVAALFTFSWKALALAVVLWWVAGSLGIGMGYHRLLTHRSFRTPRWAEYGLTMCGTLALEGGPFFWVATHRVHHQNTDKDGDPHSPRDGGFWSHMGWIISGRVMHNHASELLPYVPDLRKDKFHTWISKWHWLPTSLLGIVLLIVGGWQYVMWGVFLRTVVGLHATWLVNSATHMWGRQRFNTGDTSTNSFWVAMLTFGEGWHNNHHAHPQSARHGLAWYEFDLNWYQISLLRLIRLASDVKLPRGSHLASRRSYGFCAARTFTTGYPDGLPCYTVKDASDHGSLVVRQSDLNSRPDPSLAFLPSVRSRR